MGQKVHPSGFRVGITKPWMSRWYAKKKDYTAFLHEDIKFRKTIHKRLQAAGISKVEVERAANKVKIHIHTSRPGLVIGKKGTGIDAIREELQKKSPNEIFLDIVEVRKAETDAQLVSEHIATQLERRVSFRRAMKKSMQSAMKLGAKGIKVMCAGRLGGAEIARTEWYREGRVPLQTLRADVTYGEGTAHTTYGTIGVKVWIFKGEII